jgi:multiple antibiotic resistance protein
MGDLTMLLQFALLAFSSLFFIVNPFEAASLFVTMTQGDTPDKRARTAWRAVLTACVTLVVFAVLGDVLLQLFAITLGAFRIAGGIIIFGIGMNMLRAQTSREIQTPEEVREGAEKEDIAIIPLAILMLSGPGAMSTVLVLDQRAQTWGHLLALVVVIVCTCCLSYLILRSAAPITHLLGQTGQRIVSRLMGLLLAVIAVQFILNGIADALPQLLPVHLLGQSVACPPN